MNATVVVSTYKQEKYIKECLYSILNQKTNFDFRIIVSDDCSPDKTLDIISEVDQENPGRLIIIQREKNLGAAGNYLDAHRRADGDIVFHIDGDDLMLPGKMQKQYDIFLADPEVNLVLHRAAYFTDAGDLNRYTGRFFKDEGRPVCFTARNLATWGTIGVHSSYAFRRSERKRLGIHREFMEWFFAMDVLLPSGYGVFLDEILVKYRESSQGSYLSTKKGKEKAYKIYLNDIQEYFQEHEELRTSLYANFLITIMAMVKNKISINGSIMRFLFINIKYFSIFKLIETAKTRNHLSPKDMN